MAVKVHYRHGAVCAVDGAQQRQGDGVVAAEGDDARQGLALLGWAGLVRVGCWIAREDAVVALLDLVKRPAVVVPVAQTHQEHPVSHDKLPYHDCEELRFHPFSRLASCFSSLSL